MIILDTASSIISWVYCDLQCHWCSEQFRCQERFIKALEERDII